MADYSGHYAIQELAVHRVTANCFLDNETSRRLMERVGMRRELHAVRESLHRSGRWLDTVGCAILEEEWAPPDSSVDIPSQARRSPTRYPAGRGCRSPVTRCARATFFPEFATNPINGNLSAVWQDARFSPTGASKIAFSQSTDGGLTWNPVIRIDQSPGNTQAFLPQIHVASDGTVGLLYYDLQNATAAQPGLTDAFIAHCHSATTDCTNQASCSRRPDQAEHKRLVRLPNPPNAGGLFLGDYAGLTSSGTTFKALFDMSQPIATTGRSDTFSNSAR